MSRIYYGWWITIAMFLMLFIHGGAGFYIFGIFYTPLINEFGWHRSDIAIAMAIYISAIALSAPFTGHITDRLGARKVIVTGAVFAGLTFLLISRVTSIWQFYSLYFLLGISLGSACGLIPSASLISKWFTEKRGLAMGISTAGLSFGALLLVTAGGYILNNADWRSAYLFLAILTWIIILPAAIILIKDKPQNNHPAAGNADKTENLNIHKISIPGLLKDPSFRLLMIASFFVFISLSSILQHEVNYFIEAGIDPLTAASVLAFTGGMGGLGKVTFGYVADIITPKKALLLSFAIQITGIILLLNSSSLFIIWLFAAVYGFSMGSQLALQPLVIGQFYGVAALGSILGVSSIAGAAGTAIGPMLAAIVRDAGIGYDMIFSACIVCVAISAVAIFFAKPAAVKKTLDSDVIT